MDDNTLRRIDEANHRIWEAAQEDPEGSIAEAAELGEQSEAASYPRGKAEALRTAGYALSVLDDMEGGFAKMQEALEVLDAPGVDEPGVAATVHDTLANLYFFVGMYAQSFEHSSTGMEYARRAGHTRVEAYCLRNMGLLYSLQRDHDRARELFTRSRRLFERIDYRIGIAWTQYHLGELEVSEGRAESAVEYFRLVMDSVSEHEVATLYASARKDMARALWKLGRLQEARRLAESAAHAPRRFTRIRTDMELIRGHICVDLGQHEEALSILKETAELAAANNHSRVEADAHQLRAQLLADAGEFEAAYHEQARAHQALSNLLTEDSERELRNTELRHSLEAVRREEEARRFEDLRRMNEELEERVRRRTRDLEEERERLEETNRELARTSSEREDLIRILSHDLRNPFSAIRQMLQFIDKSGDQAEYIEEIRRSTENGLETIDSVRQMLAVESGKKQLEMVSIDIHDAVEAAAQVVRRRFGDKDIHLENRVASGTLGVADHGTFVNSVLTNLLGNAAKFSNPGGAVSVSAEPADGRVRIFIRDHGIGIPEDLLTSIFDPFAPTTREGTRGERGTGFGMPLIQRLMARYGGSIDITSSTEGADHGTTVAISLPVGRGPGVNAG